MNSQTQSHIDPDPSSDQAIKGWIGSLGSHDPNVRKTAYGRLTGIGKPAMPALIQLTADPEPELRREAAAILGDIGDPTSIPTLIDLLVDEAFEVRWRAAESLVKMKRESVIPMFQALRNSDRFNSVSWSLEGTHHILRKLDEEGYLGPPSRQSYRGV